MTAAKQKEIVEQERYVKKYELDATLVAIFNEFKEENNKRFDDIKDQLNAGFSGLATVEYVEKKISKCKEEIYEKVKLTYGNQAKGIDKLKWIIVGGLVGVSMQVITFYILYGGIK